jgi:hypothetical protein
VAAKGLKIHIRKTPLNLSAKPQNPGGIEGFANTLGVNVEGVFLPSPLQNQGFSLYNTALFSLPPLSIRKTRKTPKQVSTRGCDG